LGPWFYWFLHLHQNQVLLEQLQTGYKAVLASQKKGISYFRVTLTRFYWDIFLRYFNFGRGGPLQVWVDVPGFDDDKSEIYTCVRICKPELMIDEDELLESGITQDAEKSLSWVLDALYLYPYDLGLIIQNSKGGKNEPFL